MSDEVRNLAYAVKQLEGRLQALESRRVNQPVHRGNQMGGAGGFTWFEASVRSLLDTPTAAQIPALGYTTQDYRYWEYKTGTDGWVCTSDTYVVAT